MLPTGFGNSVIFQLFLRVVSRVTKSLTILWRNISNNRCFTFDFDHKRLSRTVKMTRVLGCNRRNRRRIRRGRGKSCKWRMRNWELASQIKDERTERGKIGRVDGCSGFRRSLLCDRGHVCDLWLVHSDPFFCSVFQGSLLVSVLFRAIISLLRTFFWSFLRISASFPRQKFLSPSQFPSLFFEQSRVILIFAFVANLLCDLL